jgi:hypothetical protein
MTVGTFRPPGDSELVGGEDVFGASFDFECAGNSDVSPFPGGRLDNKPPWFDNTVPPPPLLVMTSPGGGVGSADEVTACSSLAGWIDRCAG